MTRTWPLLILVLLLICFENFWMWDNDAFVFGIPVNLFYHIGLCVATTLAMLVVVRWGWPHHLDEDDPK